MTTITVKTRHWLPRLCGADAMTIGKTIYIKGLLYTDRLLVHECQHVKQWVESGRVIFLAKYLADYLRGRRDGQTHPAAYLGIGFEEEARAMAQQYATWQEWSAGESFPVVIHD